MIYQPRVYACYNQQSCTSIDVWIIECSVKLIYIYYIILICSNKSRFI